MRIHRGVSVLATAAIIASSAPSAGAQAISGGNGGGSGSSPVAVSSQPSTDSGSTDWGLIGVSAAGGAVLAAAGMTASRRHSDRTAPRSTATLS